MYAIAYTYIYIMQRSSMLRKNQCFPNIYGAPGFMHIDCIQPMMEKTMHVCNIRTRIYDREIMKTK